MEVGENGAERYDRGYVPGSLSADSARRNHAAVGGMSLRFCLAVLVAGGLLSGCGTTMKEMDISRLGAKRRFETPMARCER